MADSVSRTTHPNRCQHEQGREAVGRQGRGLSSLWVRFAVADGLQEGLAFANPHPTTIKTMNFTISLLIVSRQWCSPPRVAGSWILVGSRPTGSYSGDRPAYGKCKLPLATRVDVLGKALLSAESQPIIRRSENHSADHLEKCHQFSARSNKSANLGYSTILRKICARDLEGGTS